ncbi:hypothetical protein VTP01DRAFT_3869 [Rhizomucor pusillus]|uniref:uncharacterized protein n=1 Tax=Rhizomucor pusillus TaxID=4840 RepID=UPI0037423B19
MAFDKFQSASLSTLVNVFPKTRFAPRNTDPSRSHRLVSGEMRQRRSRRRFIDPLVLRRIWSDRIITAAIKANIYVEHDVDPIDWQKLVKVKSDISAKAKTTTIQEGRRQTVLDLWVAENDATAMWLRRMQNRQRQESIMDATGEEVDEIVPIDGCLIYSNTNRKRLSQLLKNSPLVCMTGYMPRNLRIPSDITVDHHPKRLFSNYSLDDTTDGFNVTEACRNFAKVSAQLPKPEALNNIFLFASDLPKSITKYFGYDRHSAILDSLIHESEIITPTNKVLGWCMRVSLSRLSNWISIMAMNSRFLNEAVESKDPLEIYTATALLQLTSRFSFSSAPDTNVEDTFEHAYLSPLLHTVFESEALLKTNCLTDTKGTLKPDFIVYVKTINTHGEILAAEFKPPNAVCQLESDKVKLSKEMRLMYNRLVIFGVSNQVVCGILVENHTISTFKMDMPSPRFYRVTKLSEAAIFKSIREFSLIPDMLVKIMQVKDIALLTARKIERTMVAKSSNSIAITPSPPLSWLDQRTCTLVKKRKREME